MFWDRVLLCNGASTSFISWLSSIISSLGQFLSFKFLFEDESVFRQAQTQYATKNDLELPTLLSLPSGELILLYFVLLFGDKISHWVLTGSGASASRVLEL